MRGFKPLPQEKGMELTTRQQNAVLGAVNVKNRDSVKVWVLPGTAEPPMLVDAWDLVVVGELWFVANVD